MHSFSPPPPTPLWPLFPPSWKKNSKCVEASFFTLPKRLCCQRGTLRKSLFLPGRASRVPPASLAVLMAVPPPAGTLIPGRAALQQGTITIPLCLWSSDHMEAQQLTTCFNRQGGGEGRRKGWRKRRRGKSICLSFSLAHSTFRKRPIPGAVVVLV